MRLIDLYEAKAIHDYRHPPSDLAFWGSDPPDYIDPKDGFHFTYYRGKFILSSTSNEVYSAAVLGQKAVDLWNQFGGKVDHRTKTITISKEVTADDKKRQRNFVNVPEIQKTFRELMAFGVTPDYKIKGVPPEAPKTVSAALMAADPIDKVLRSQPLIMYHGTSLSRWEKIQKEGLRPSKTTEKYPDLKAGYSEFNVYLATTPKAALFYAKRQADKDEEYKCVVLRVEVPDPAKLRPDDIFVNTVSPETMTLNNKTLRRSREMGEFGYNGFILPKHISLYKQFKA